MVQGYNQAPERRSCLSRICGCGITLALLGGGGYLIWHFLGRPQTVDEAQQAMGDAFEGFKDNFGDFSDVLGNLTDNDWVDGFINHDPFGGKSFVGDNSTNAWATDGTGLELEIWNALDDTWQSEFQVALDDWQEAPALSLKVKQVDVDYECTPVDDIMKVCNGNFGESGWLGINEMEIMYKSPNAPGFIKNSVAKMNEFYLRNADYDQRRFTMCHEIGHGFGLPHTDENPYNDNLGNCLDYTNDPSTNLLPGQVNFDRLDQIYLKPESDTGNNDRPYNGNEGFGNEQGEKRNNNNNRRQLRRETTSTSSINEQGYIVVKKVVYLYAWDE